jgi:hypothetical protein
LLVSIMLMLTENFKLVTDLFTEIFRIMIDKKNSYCIFYVFLILILIIAEETLIFWLLSTLNQKRNIQARNSFLIQIRKKYFFQKSELSLDVFHKLTTRFFFIFRVVFYYPKVSEFYQENTLRPRIQNCEDLLKSHYY